MNGSTVVFVYQHKPTGCIMTETFADRRGLDEDDNFWHIATLHAEHYIRHTLNSNPELVRELKESYDGPT